MGEGDGVGVGDGETDGLGDGDGEDDDGDGLGSGTCAGRSVMISDPARALTPAFPSRGPVLSVVGGTKSAAISVALEGAFGSWMLNRFVIELYGETEVEASAQ